MRHVRCVVAAVIVARRERVTPSQDDYEQRANQRNNALFTMHGSNLG
jgi:hypothetical protein